MNGFTGTTIGLGGVFVTNSVAMGINKLLHYLR